MANQKTINRNNRKRGSAFEKRVADFLDMYVVPYSGSNARYGYGDVRDCEGITGGNLLGECKNMTCNKDVFNIKKQWWEALNKRADMYNMIPFLAFMQKGKPQKYVMMHYDDFIRCVEIKDKCKHLHRHEIIRKPHNMVNYRIPVSELSLNVKNRQGIPYIMITNIEGQKHYFAIMTLNHFKDGVIHNKIHARYQEGGDLYED